MSGRLNGGWGWGVGGGWRVKEKTEDGESWKIMRLRPFVASRVFSGLYTHKR